MEEIRFEYDCDVETPHFHDELEILYVLSGRIGVMLDKSNCLLGQEDFIIFNPFEHHELFREAGCHTLSAYIPLPIQLQCNLGRISCCSVTQQAQSIYLDLFRAKLAVTYKNYQKGEAVMRLHILSNVYGLLALLKQHFEIPDGILGDKDAIRSADRMRQVLLYVHTHYTENISLQEVAKEMYMSTGHLSRQFEKQMGIHFSEYVRKLRLHKAAKLLRSTNKSILEIAEECGFSNVNTLINNFKTLYGQTPNVYRRESPHSESDPTTAKIEPASYIRLLKYARDEEGLQPLNKHNLPASVVQIDLTDTKEKPFALQHNTAISSGYAKDYFVEGHQEIFQKSIQEIGYRYLFVQGVLDDNINIYHEYLDGTPWFNYTYLDAIIDHICSAKALPWIELSHTPEKLLEQKTMIYNDGYIQLPVDLQKWELLVDNVLEHLILRYGIENVSCWRFSLFPAFFIAYGLFTSEEYLEYHRCTWNAIRRRLPDVKIISGVFDSGYLMLDGDKLLVQYLQYCQSHHCMPDEIGLQCFGIDYSALSRKEIESRIIEQVIKKTLEPAPPIQDEDFTRHSVEFVQHILESCHAENLPICLVYWNSTIWSHDLGNDTCYKSAYIVKNCLELAGRVSSLNNNLFLDQPTNRYDVPGPFYGDIGNINYMGIPKAAYFALTLLSQLEPFLLAKGDGYAVTCSEDHKSIRILLYHYCHYNPDTHLDQVLPWEEQLTIDRYCGFLDPGIRSFQLYLQGLENGTYDKERYIINRETGSSYDAWRKMGSPQTLTAKQKNYLIHASTPGYRYEQFKLHNREDIMLSAALDAHEVQLICLTKQDG